MKLNKKGFMLAEVIVVSVILIATLVGLFTGFNKMYSNYKERNSYDNVDALYAAKSIKDFLIDQTKLNELIKNTVSFNNITNSTSISLSEYETTLYNNIKEEYDIKNIYFSVYNINNIEFDTTNNTLTSYLAYLRKDSNLTKSNYAYRIVVQTNKNNFSTIGLGTK